jgi:hypothetical protein
MIGLLSLNILLISSSASAPSPNFDLKASSNFLKSLLTLNSLLLALASSNALLFCLNNLLFILSAVLSILTTAFSSFDNKAIFSFILLLSSTSAKICLLISSCCFFNFLDL